MNEWLKGWIKKGWKNSLGKTVENIELWKQLNELNRNKRLRISFRWVRGHKGKNVSIETVRDSYFNEMCDSLLTESLKPYRMKNKK